MNGAAHGNRWQTVLGLDPGLGTTGYGVVSSARNGVRLVEGGTLRTSSDHSLPIRLAEIYRGVARIIEEFRPDVVVIEELYSKYAHPRTAILMGHARGVACLAAAQAGVQVVGYAPAAMKRALTGNGRASKQQVARAVCAHLGIEAVPRSSDVTDALALAVCHCFVGTAPSPS
ncbi:MAG: crossover junction endodeoxyribonuclease RuvC [Armatimonadota bacterium]